jgi:hypothetical protein
MVLAASAIGLAWWQFGGEGKTSGAGRSEDQEPAVTAQRLMMDDSGLTRSLNYVYVLKDPKSLENIRDSFQGAGYRGIQIVERRLGSAILPPEQQFEALFLLTQLHLCEGQTKQAYEALARARAIAEEDRSRYSQQLATIIFLQGVTGLRQGETENCVECQCVGSCIFPLQASAIHQKREGSERAILHFKEYLRGHPDDDGVRWLLNIAYMTLGEYPDKVPTQDLLPPSLFKSEMDIGRFRDVAPQLGVDRFHQAGGAIMEDFDNDGYLDIIETSWDTAIPMKFFKNQGDGTFVDRSREGGVENQLGGLYCCQTDYNNDGHLDIFVCRGAWVRIAQRPSLLRNNGNGTFTDVTREAGLNTPMDGQVGVWADYDHDGFVDVFVGSESGASRLYRNKGDGTFEDVASQAGVTNNRFAKGANWGDFDNDGYPDLYVSNLEQANRLYRNNRNGTFTDVAPEMGVSAPSKSFACWFFDYDNDGWLDLWCSTYEYSLTEMVRSMIGRPHMGETCRLYRNLQGKGFKDVSREAGVDISTCPMGCNFADYDNDGYLDFYLGTGNPNYSALVPNHMFKNVEGKRFANITTSSGTGHLQKGHVVSSGDWDRNGYVDLFHQLGGATPGDQFRSALFQNPCQGNRSLTVRLVGKKSNRAAFGARITATPAGDSRLVHRHVTCGSSFGGNPLEQTLGLGKADKVARLEIFWPTSGTRQVLTDVPAGQVIEITEGVDGFRKIDVKRLPVPE